MKKFRTNPDCFRNRGNQTNNPNKQVSSSGWSCRLGKACVSTVSERFVVIEDCRRLNIGEVLSGSISSAEREKTGEIRCFRGVFFMCTKNLPVV